jgi:hypothetical protein
VILSDSRMTKKEDAVLAFGSAVVRSPHQLAFPSWRAE